MDGTASLVYLLGAKEAETAKPFSYDHGAIVRGDSTKKQIALVFTGDEFGDGGRLIAKTLKDEKVKASFFLTGRFYVNPAFTEVVQGLKKAGHYLGPHSNQHLLYCDWQNRDSLLVSRKQFSDDLLANLSVMQTHGLNTQNAKFFMPPFEWYNDSIAAWSKQLGLQLINYTPGTLSHTDYTTPDDRNYRTSEAIYRSIVDYEKMPQLNGFILLMHIGTDQRRMDKFYLKLPQLIGYLKRRGYQLKTIEELLK